MWGVGCSRGASAGFAAVVLGAWTLAAGQGLTAVEILRRSAKAEEANDRAVELYTWHERDVVHELNRKTGASKVASDDTYWVSQVRGAEFRLQIAHHGKPLTPAQEAKARRAMQATIAKQARHAAERARQREEERAEHDRLLEEVPRAFRFTLEGERRTPLCDCYVIAGAPAPGYRPRDQQLKLLRHFAGTLWIDTKTFSVVQIDMTILQPISWGWFLARIGRGGHVILRQQPVDGHWFPAELTADVGARLLLVKHFDLALDQQYADYQKFRAIVHMQVITPH